MCFSNGLSKWTFGSRLMVISNNEYDIFGPNFGRNLRTFGGISTEICQNLGGRTRAPRLGSWNKWWAAAAETSEIDAKIPAKIRTKIDLQKRPFGLPNSQKNYDMYSAIRLISIFCLLCSFIIESFANVLFVLFVAEFGHNLRRMLRQISPRIFQGILQ